MRKVLMVAAAAAIALVGLSANTCGGEEKTGGAGDAASRGRSRGARGSA